MTRRLWALSVAASVVVLAIVGVVALSGGTSRRTNGGDHRARLEPREGEKSGKSPAVEAYEDRAYPRKYVTAAQVKAATASFERLPTRLKAASFRRGTPDVQARAAVGTNWDFVGPDDPFTPGPTTESLRDSVTSGRVTALAISPSCDAGGTGAGACRLWVASAGGGIWRTDDALAATPHWTALENGLPTNAFGSLVLDPNDASGNTLYAGTGEANAINQAGLGLYRSTDGGDSWSIVPGSFAVAHDRSIGALQIATDAQHTIWMGTSAGTQGQSSANGGAAVPPGAPEMGVYKSTDGGASFSLQKSMTPQGPSNLGGVNHLEIDPVDPTHVYAAFFGYGIWRTPDSGATWVQVFTPDNAGSLLARRQRTEFALTRANAKTRIYAADGGTNPADFSPTGDFYRADDANTAAAGPSHPGWNKLSSSTDGTPGFGSFQLCQGQCSYDLFVGVDPSNPDVVWFGGSMVYEEIRPLQDQSLAGTANRSNGRSVMRSTDAGVTFTDMTADTRDTEAPGQHYEQMHPDQHAIAFDPKKPAIAIVGSDGGVVRTDGQYVDASTQCANREGSSPGSTITAGSADDRDCRQWLSQIPHHIENMNVGLGTLQFNSLSVDPRDPNGDLMGGTQDNGTFVLSNYLGAPDRSWFESVNGDGGPSAFDAADPNVRVHTYFLGAGDVNHHGTDPHFWALITEPILTSGEATSFYTPLLGDPKVPGTLFVAAQHVWRSKDNGGDQAALEAHCLSPGGVPEYDHKITCGDFQPLGADLTNPALGTRPGQYVVAVERAPSDTGTLWSATRVGRLFVSRNADAADPAAVGFNRIDTAATPSRFISGIAIDPNDANHAFVSYSGYFGGNPTGVDNPGHVFDVRYDPASTSATFTDISANLPDQPVTDIVDDDLTGDLYAATDNGVVRRPAGATDWERATGGLPLVSTPGLTIVPKGRALYAATYGRSIWKLALAPVAKLGGPDTVATGQTVTFDGRDSAAAGSAAYKWTLPDGSTATTPTADYRGSGSPGPQTVTLAVTDSRGRTATATKQITLTGAAGPGGGSSGGVAKPQILSRRIRFNARRHGAVRIRCGVSARGRCRGTLRITRSGKLRITGSGTRLSRRSFSVRPDRVSTVRMTISRANLRRLTRRRTMSATVTLATRGADGKARTATKRVKLLAPRHRHRHRT